MNDTCSTSFGRAWIVVLAIEGADAFGAIEEMPVMRDGGFVLLAQADVVVGAGGPTRMRDRRNVRPPAGCNAR